MPHWKAAPPGENHGSNSNRRAAANLASEDWRLKHLYGPVARAPPPEPPAHTVYNAGKAQYELPSHATDGRPRRCRAGAGRPSYSTRAATAPSVGADARWPPAPPQAQQRKAAAVPPPVAGSLAPRANPPVGRFRDAVARRELPVRLGLEPGRRTLGLNWEVAPAAVEDVERVLPLLLEGVRETEPEYRFLALQGAVELIGAVGSSGKLLPVLPSLVAPLRVALNIRERSVVVGALKLLQECLTCHALAGRALRPHYAQLLPPMAAFALKGQPTLGDSVEYSQHRRVNVADLVNETLAMMEARGGDGAGAAIKRFVPSFQVDEPASLHRGFRKPASAKPKRPPPR